MWTGLPVEESIRMTEINGESTSMVWPTLGSRTAKEQNTLKVRNESQPSSVPGRVTSPASWPDCEHASGPHASSCPDVPAV